MNRKCLLLITTLLLLIVNGYAQTKTDLMLYSREYIIRNSDIDVRNILYCSAFSNAITTEEQIDYIKTLRMMINDFVVKKFNWQKIDVSVIAIASYFQTPLGKTNYAYMKKDFFTFVDEFPNNNVANQIIGTMGTYAIVQTRIVYELFAYTFFDKKIENEIMEFAQYISNDYIKKGY